MKSTTSSELVMDYHKDSRMYSDASSSIFNGKDMIHLTSYSISDSIPESEMSNVESVTTVSVSPPRQTMEGYEYDPNRIPSPVFASKPPNQVDWSRASVEADSLFSITIGRNYRADWLSDYKRRTSQAEATNSGKIRMDSQTEGDFLELKIDKAAGGDGSDPAMLAASPPARENVDGKTEKGEERTSPRVIKMAESVCEDETNEDNKTKGSISYKFRLEDKAGLPRKDPEGEERTSPRVSKMSEPVCEDETNEDSKTKGFISYKFRLEDKSGQPRKDPPKTIEIEIVEEDVQPLTDDQAPNAASGGWISCFQCCISWKFVCCGCF